jgi:serine/threonine protein kinase/tetratricopeptide (TPR) repeat protein
MTATGCDEILDVLTPAQEEQLAGVLDEYLVSLERGVPLPLEDIVARHPDLADPLRTYADSLQFLCLATDQFARGRPAVPPAHGGERVLGDYRLIREIGRGGMGVVYEAEQLSLGRRVALKVLPFAALMDDKQLTRFANEARAAAQLNHPHIVPVFGVGNARGVHYYSMQLVNGRALDRVIQELREWQTTPRDTRVAAGTVPAHGPSPPATSDSLLGRQSLRDRAYYRTVAQLGIQATEALQHAHEQGVVHRDIKPSNLLLDSAGELWITDFGLARVQTDTNLTLSGAVMGTARYMSPEQAAGKTHLVDHRADLYALGITLYELLTLRPAFDGSTPQQLLRQIERDDPPSPRRINPAIPADLETIVLKAIDKDREARYQTAAELAEDLQRFLDGLPTGARRPTWLDRIGKWTRRQATLVAAAAAVLFVALVATAISAVLVSRQKQHTTAALLTAERQLERAEANYRQARRVLDRYGLRLAEQLAGIPGVEPLRRELLEDTWQHYEALLRQTQDDPALRAEQAATHFKAGEIAAQLGDAQRAIRAYSASRDAFAALVEQQPAGTEHRSRLALCYNNLGLILAGCGRTSEAAQALRQAEELAADLCRDEPATAAHRWRLSLVHTNTGLLHSHSGNSLEADACYGRAIGLLESLVEQEPASDEYCKDLAVAYNNRGALHRSTSPAQAAQDNGRALALLTRLAEKHPERRDFQSQLALCQSNQGVLFAELDSATEAVQVLQRAIASQEQLVRKTPAVVSYRRDLAVSYNNLGRVLLDEHDLSGADQALAKAQAILADLTTDYQATVEHWASVGGVLNNRATIRERQGDLDEAAALYKQAIERLTRATDLAPSAVEPRRFLEQTRQNYTRVLSRATARAEAQP